MEREMSLNYTLLYMLLTACQRICFPSDDSFRWVLAAVMVVRTGNQCASPWGIISSYYVKWRCHETRPRTCLSMDCDLFMQTSNILQQPAVRSEMAMPFWNVLNAGHTMHLSIFSQQIYLFWGWCGRRGWQESQQSQWHYQSIHIVFILCTAFKHTCVHILQHVDSIILRSC